jgi:hypothetical protein
LDVKFSIILWSGLENPPDPDAPQQIDHIAAVTIRASVRTDTWAKEERKERRKGESNR